MERAAIAGAIAVATLAGAGCDSADEVVVPGVDSTPAATGSTAHSASSPTMVATTTPGAEPTDAAAVETTAAPPHGGTEAMYDDQPIDQGLQPAIRTAITDLAGRLGLDEREIEAISAVRVTWPDSSLGCPQPGMSYMQVLTDGSVIELRAAGLIYRYHSGRSRPPFLCDRPLTPRPPVVDTA